MNPADRTIAQQIVAQLNAYETKHAASEEDGDIWGDILYRQKDVDYGATDDADPSDRGDVAVFTDSSRVRYSEDSGEWVAR